MDLTLWRFVEHEVRCNFVNIKCITWRLSPTSTPFIMALSTFMLYQTKHDCALSNKARDGGDNVMNEEWILPPIAACHSGWLVIQLLSVPDWYLTTQLLMSFRFIIIQVY
eukprot:790289_1